LSDSLQVPPSFPAFEDDGVSVRPLEIPTWRRALLAPLVGFVTPGLRRYAWGAARIAPASLYARVVAPLICDHTRDADLIHVWAGDLLAAASLRAAARQGLPVVISPFAHPNQYGLGPVDVRSYRSADSVVALLEADASVYRSMGVKASNVFISGVGTNGAEPGHGERIRRDHGIEGPLVVYLGVRRPYKGFDLLLAAAPIVSRAVDEVTFAFLGPGAPLPSAASRARVLDVGLVSEAERAGWLEAADVMCLPSEAEIFPVSVLEAWSVGTPVVLSDIPPLVELVGRAGGGVTAKREPQAVADAIISILDDPQLARLLGEAGREFWSRAHTIGAVAQRYEEIYSRLCDVNETGSTGL
jgi:glycosyltransferase involved in cell wall biosynthesis